MGAFLGRIWAFVGKIWLFALVGIVILGLFVWPGWARSPSAKQVAVAVVGAIPTQIPPPSAEEIGAAIARALDQPQDKSQPEQENRPEETVSEPPMVAKDCRSLVWWTEAFSDTLDVASLISVLDRDFTLSDGAQWSEPGYAVPMQAVFWTDLFENRSSLPAGTQAVRTQGGWGVYYTSVKYVVPLPNGGGRWMRLCESLTEAEPEQPERVIQVAAAIATCNIPELTGMSTSEAVGTMNQWFEETGYQWGGSFASGDELSSDTIFWTDLGEGILPSHIIRLATEGNWGVFKTTQEFVAPNGGRYVVCS